jgi:hypothetical protein
MERLAVSSRTLTARRKAKQTSRPTRNRGHVWPVKRPLISPRVVCYTPADVRSNPSPDQGAPPRSTYRCSLFFVLTVVLIIALVGSIPKWPHSKGWGYFPSVGLGLVLLVLLILAIMHRL